MMQRRVVQEFKVLTEETSAVLVQQMSYEIQTLN